MAVTIKQNGKPIDIVDKVFDLVGLLIKLKDELLTAIPEVQRELSKHGWYVAEGITVQETFAIAIEAVKGNQNKLDEFMADFYRKNIAPLTSVLIKKYPERSALLNEALMAHKKKMYFSSVTLFLTQADGICSGVLFKSNNKKKSIKNLVKKRQLPDHLEIFLTAIKEETAIDTPYPVKSNFESGLNRHGVLHGIDTSYGNEMNSLKAFALLSFVGTFLDMDIQTMRENKKSQG